jgi:kinesin family protein 6/9
LTNILKDSLGGNCSTAFIACIWGESAHLEETVSTLKLAQRMMRVENSASTNVQSNPELLVKRYKRQIAELKQELMMHDSLGKFLRALYMWNECTVCCRIARSKLPSHV